MAFMQARKKMKITASHQAHAGTRAANSQLFSGNRESFDLRSSTTATLLGPYFTLRFSLSFTFHSFFGCFLLHLKILGECDKSYFMAG